MCIFFPPPCTLTNNNSTAAAPFIVNLFPCLAVLLFCAHPFPFLFASAFLLVLWVNAKVVHVCLGGRASN